MTLRRSIISIIVLLLIATAALAQTPAPPQELPTNIYAAGLSYNVGGSPAIAGTGLYAHLVTDSGTYAFTAVDALPVSVKPFAVSTNFSLGVAQKLVTIGKVPIFIPTSAGISYNGTNTGWAWTAGALASIKLKDGFALMPHVRLVKSSVSNGAGYQPILGVLVAFGQ